MVSASIQERKRTRNPKKSYRVQIRGKGFAASSATFDTGDEARAYANEVNMTARLLSAVRVASKKWARTKGPNAEFTVQTEVLSTHVRDLQHHKGSAAYWFDGTSAKGGTLDTLMTVADGVRQFRAAKGARLTRAEVTSLNVIEEDLGNLFHIEVQPKDIETFVRSRRLKRKATRRSKRSKPSGPTFPAPGTLSHDMLYLGRLFTWMHSILGMKDHSPVVAAVRKQLQKEGIVGRSRKTGRALSRPQIQALRTEIEARSDEDICLRRASLLQHTGIFRPDEISEITGDDVRLPDRIAVIPWRKNPNSDEDAEVPLVPVFHIDPAEIIADQISDARNSGTYDGSQPLFPYTTKELRGFFYEISAACALPRFVPYDLRHTGVQELCHVCNGNIFLVQKITGHRDLNSLAHYFRMSAREAIEEFESYHNCALPRFSEAGRPGGTQRAQISDLQTVHIGHLPLHKRVEILCTANWSENEKRAKKLLKNPKMEAAVKRFLEIPVPL